MPYLPGLDGLRAVAVVAVMIYHANHDWLGGGFLGVEVFFVISGYLITLLLIGEHERNGFVEIGTFWLRRARRLLPALFVMLAGLAIYMSIFQRGPQGRTRGDFLGGILYVSNWYQVFVGQGYAASGAFAPLRHLWSLAVEEQFYLLWPLAMVLILRRGRRSLPHVGLWLAGVSVLIAVVVAVLYAGGDVATTCTPGVSEHGYWNVFGRCINVNETLYLSTITRAGGLMLGAAFAMVWRPFAIMRGPLRNRGRQLDLLAVVGLAGLALLAWKLTLSVSGTTLGVHYDAWLFRGGFLWTGLATLLIIAAVTHQGAVSGRLLGNPLFNWVGTRSYGLYLFHWPIYQIIRKYAGIPLTGTQFVVAMVVTAPITELSYRFVETPIRRGRLGAWWRDRRQHGPAHPLDSRRPVVAFGVIALALVGYSVVSIGRAANQCVGDVECGLAAAQRGTDPTTTTAPLPTIAPPHAGSTVPGESTTTAQTTTTLPPPPPAMLAFGESVMLGATQTMEKGGFVVDAAENRQAKGMIAEITARRAAGQIGPLVVIQVGTNGTVSDDEFAQIMAQLPPVTTPDVYFLTVRANKPWIGPNNDKIHGLRGKYPNVKNVLEWQVLADQVAGDLSSSDGGAHLTTQRAKQYYANIIFDVIGRSDLEIALQPSG